MIAYDFVLCIYEPIRSRSNIVRISLPSNLLEREINKITLPEAFCADRLDRSDNLRYQSLLLTHCNRLFGPVTVTVTAELTTDN